MPIIELSTADVADRLKESLEQLLFDLSADSLRPDAYRDAEPLLARLALVHDMLDNVDHLRMAARADGKPHAA